MKKYICFAAAVAFCIPLFSQNAASSESQIELPDLTTVVAGGQDADDFAPPPSFEDVLDIPYDSGELVPVLPSISAGDEGDLISAGNQSDQKDIYAQGQIGGGYPASFSGDFEISRLYGADPFMISFNHDSAAGFASHNLADGYKESQTSITLEKDFIRKDLKFGVSALYEDRGNGLQSKVEGISAYNQDSIGLGANLLWSLPKDFYLGFDLDSLFYFRFSDLTKPSAGAAEVPKWIRNTSRVTADPQFKISWNHNGFDISFDALYNLEAWNKVSNRGQVDLNFSWKNDKVKLFADAGVVFGNTIGDNIVIPPFELGLETWLPVYFSDRKLNLSLSGGLESKRQSVSELEKCFKFSGMEQLSSESSNWFGKVNLLVPLKSSFTGNVSAGYSRTAFGNGQWTPDYSAESLTCGLYGFSPKKRNELFTDFAFTWKYKIFAATAKYHASWLDIPVLENKHTVSVNFALQSQKGLWGASLDTAYLLDAADNKPVINLEGFVQVSEAVRIVLSANDLLKLLGAEERMYAGQYVGNSGNAMLLVKFLF